MNTLFAEGPFVPIAPLHCQTLFGCDLYVINEKVPHILTSNVPLTDHALVIPVRDK